MAWGGEQVTVFISSFVLQQAVADRLKLAGVSTLPDHYLTSILPDALNGSYQEILGRLMARGFTKEQVDSFDRGAEFQRAIGIYLALVNGGVYAGMDPETMKCLDRRKELDSVLVFNAGIWIKPVGNQPGLVVTAGASAQGGIFNWPTGQDDEAPGLGNLTRF